MTRQWLALIALLTGLAAVGAPVNAQAAQALSCEIGASAEASPDTAARCAAAHLPTLSVTKASKQVQHGELQRPQMPIPETVLIEVDRAHK